MKTLRISYIDNINFACRDVELYLIRNALYVLDCQTLTELYHK